MRFVFFPLYLSKGLRLPRKSDAKSYKVLRLSRKIILANLKIWCSKMQPLSGNERPDLLTSLINMSFVLRLPRKMHLCRSSSNAPRPPSFFQLLQNPHTTCRIHCACHAEPHPKLKKCPRTASFNTFDFEMRFFRHNGVHFFGIWTSKSVPKLKRSAHFDLETCFALQRRAPFEHRRFQKCSQCAFCAFWLGNLLRATTTCTFWTSQFPKALRTSGVFNVFPWKCASRHRALHFFDAWTSKSAPTMRRFQHFDFQMCFAPQRRAIVHLSSPQMAPHPPL